MQEIYEGLQSAKKVQKERENFRFQVCRPIEHGPYPVLYLHLPPCSLILPKRRLTRTYDHLWKVPETNNVLLIPLTRSKIIFVA